MITAVFSTQPALRHPLNDNFAQVFMRSGEEKFDLLDTFKGNQSLR